MGAPRMFLINLDRSPERLALMRAQADELGLVFERVPAVDGTSRLPVWAVAQFMDDRGHARGGLSEGEVGCYASHLLALSKIVEHRLEAAIVLEDDARLDEDFEQMALAAIRAAPAGWDCIHLSTHFKKPAFAIAELGSGRSLVRYMRLPVNSAAYAISLTGASKLVASRHRVRPFDLEFRQAWLAGLEMFGIYPALVRPDTKLPSTIQADWKDKRSKAAQVQWKPSLVSRLRGWIYVLARLGPAGAWHCWTTTLADRSPVPATACLGDRRFVHAQDGKPL